MSLTLNSLQLKNFRSYEEFSLQDISNLTVFVGENATGKTNILEAIQLLTAIHSFRNPQVNHLINESKNHAFTSAQLKGDNRELEVALKIFEGKKKYLLNGKPKQTQSLKGLCPSVMFTPDDLLIIKGSNSQRRDVLDDIGCQVSQNYRVIKRDFQTVLKNKNTLLKDGASLDMIKALNEVMIKCSSHLTCYREALFKRMEPCLIDTYQQISQSGEVLTCEYIPSWIEYSLGKQKHFSKEEAQNWLFDALEKNLSQELQRKRSFIGAHKDRINFYIDGRDASIFASQGQQRSIVLALKIAEVSVIQEILSVKPLLLLDDVMSELDEKRRTCLIDFLHDEMQVFITTTSLQYFGEDLKNQARVIEIKNK